jgi:hypothetical protein
MFRPMMANIGIFGLLPTMAIIGRDMYWLYFVIKTLLHFMEFNPNFI